jgi:hypothetical protein
MAGQGTRILASDYNAIQSTAASVLGSGSGDVGYGQVVSSSQVAVGDKIKATDWQKLKTDLIRARQHQTGASESGNLTDVTTTTLVREYDRSAYANFAALVYAQRLSAASGQMTTATLDNEVRTTAWNGTIYHNVSIIFSSQAAARYYFNSGGQIRISGSLTNIPVDGSQTKGNDWATILSNMGTISFGATGSSCSGTGTVSSGTGYYSLDTSPVTLFTKSTASPTYSPNSYTITVSGNGGAGASSTINFSIAFADLSTTANTTSYGPGYGPYGVDEPVEGTLTSTITSYYATGGNVSITTPSNYYPSASSGQIG